MSPFLRRSLAALFIAGLSGSLLAEDAVLRIGYQKYGTLVLLRAKGSLEPRLAKEGVKVQWTEFPGGPQLLEGLNVGSVDFGVTGETPPVFAQAAGIQAYTATKPITMHKSASPASVAVRSFQPGDLVYPTGQKNGIWWEVDDENGNRGWVSSAMISPR